MAIQGVVSSRKTGGSSARRDFFATFDVPLNGAPVTISLQRGLACRRCGTAWRLELGLCVGCLLSCGLDAEMRNGQTFDELLDQIDTSYID